MGEDHHAVDLLHVFGIAFLIGLHLVGEASARGDLDLQAGDAAFGVEVIHLILQLRQKLRVDALVPVHQLEVVSDRQGGFILFRGHAYSSSVSVLSVGSASWNWAALAHSSMGVTSSLRAVFSAS